MSDSRREFLGLASTLLATSATIPAFLKRTAWAAAGREPTSDRVLVVLQLTGGRQKMASIDEGHQDAPVKSGGDLLRKPLEMV